MLDISDKTTVVPDNTHTQLFAKIVSRIGIPMSVNSEGVDIGVDTSSAARRSTKKQTARVKQTKHRARRTSILAKKNHKARRLALTGVKPAQIYGHTAVGMAPTTTNKCKSNIAASTGMMGAGACATSVIRWAFRKGKRSNASADPRVCIPYDQVQSWIAMYHRMDPNARRDTHRNWNSKLKRLRQAKSMWQCVRGPADATIATLLQAKWAPRTPSTWNSPDGKPYSFNLKEGITHHQVLYAFREGLEQDLWTHASKASRGSGLEDGLPHFGPASTTYNKLIKQGKHAIARALELIVTNRSWCGSRLLEANIITEEEAQCTRCDRHTLETPYHRYYDCQANDDITADEVSSTKHLHKEVSTNTAHQCMWYRGLLPGCKLGKPVGWINESECAAIIMGDFSSIFDRTKVAGTDGGADKESDARVRRVSSGAAVFDPETQEVALLFAQVPGNQTVPRAELCALYHLLIQMKDDIAYTVYIDASYVLNGLTSTTRHYSQGTNGDLWTKMYQVTNKKQVTYLKAKSHVANGDQWQAYNMTVEAYIYNELADTVCTEASKKTARSASELKDDGKQYHLAAIAAARIAAIDAEIWKATPERIHHDGTDYTKALTSRVNAAKRKIDEAITNTDGGDDHDTFIFEGWV